VAARADRVTLQMSAELQAEVLFTIHGRWISKIPFLHDCEKACVVQVAMVMHPNVFAPAERPAPHHFYVIKNGLVAYGTRMLSAGKMWGEEIVTASMDAFFSARCMTYVHVFSISRRALKDVLAGFPESARVIKNAAMKIAMQRAIVVVSAATKALKARQNNPQALAGRTPMMALLEGGATSNGAQLDVEAVIPLLTGKEVKTIEDLEGGGVGGEAGEEPGSPGRLGRDALKGVMSRLDAQEATQKALGAKLDKVLELLEKKA